MTAYTYFTTSVVGDCSFKIETQEDDKIIFK